MADNPPTEEDVDEMAAEIARESAEMGDLGPVTEVDGECGVCGADATWQSPSGDYYCQEHATEHFKERHG